MCYHGKSFRGANKHLLANYQKAPFSEEGPPNPIIFISGGLTSDHMTEYVIYMVNEAVKANFDVCVICYRG